MAETPTSKRQREDAQIEDVEETKRYKPSSYNHILSLLDAEEEESTEDLSLLLTSLQDELSSDPTIVDPNTENNDQENNPTTVIEDCNTASSSYSSSSSSTSPCSKEDEVDDKERVMRHLLEASDDELGIPTMDIGVDSSDYGEVGISSSDGLALCDGYLWELEDETANYYTLLQSELFM